MRLNKCELRSDGAFGQGLIGLGSDRIAWVIGSAPDLCVLKGDLDKAKLHPKMAGSGLAFWGVLSSAAVSAL